MTCFSDPTWEDPIGPRAGNWHSLEFDLAHKLRMVLWAEHLRVPVQELHDGVASAVHWRQPEPGAPISVPFPNWRTEQLPSTGRLDEIIDPG